MRLVLTVVAVLIILAMVQKDPQTVNHIANLVITASAKLLNALVGILNGAVGARP